MPSQRRTADSFCCRVLEAAFNGPKSILYTMSKPKWSIHTIKIPLLPYTIGLFTFFFWSFIACAYHIIRAHSERMVYFTLAISVHRPKLSPWAVVDDSFNLYTQYLPSILRLAFKIRAKLAMPIRLPNSMSNRRFDAIHLDVQWLEQQCYC